MPVFKDQGGREWTVSLDAPLIREVRKECGIDPVSGEAYERAYDDSLLLGDILAVLCREQIVKVGIHADQFRALIRGDVADAALKAFHEAQIDFSPGSRREVLRATAAKMNQIRETANQKIMQRLNSTEFAQQLEAALDKRMENTLNDALTQLTSATSLPASSE